MKGGAEREETHSLIMSFMMLESSTIKMDSDNSAKVARLRTTSSTLDDLSRTIRLNLVLQHRCTSNNNLQLPGLVFGL